MGALFILPVAGISAWIIYSAIRHLRRGEVPPVWRSRLIILLIIGAGLGAYFSFGRKAQPTAHLAVKSFPVPTTIYRLENEVWKENVPPWPIKVSAHLADFAFGIAIALLPLKIAGLLSQLKFRENESK